MPLWVLWLGCNLAGPMCWQETRPRHATPTWSFLSSGKTRTLTSPSLNKPSWSMRSCSKADRCRLARRDADRLYQTVPGRRRPHRMLSADDCPEVILWEICRPDLVTPVTRRLRKPLGRIVGISDKWSGKLPRYHLPGDLLFAICGACGTERKCRQCRQDLL